MSNIWNKAPRKFVDPKAPASQRSVRQDFGTGKGNPDDNPSSGGMPFHAAFSFQNPNPGAGVPCKGNKVVKGK
jgi:hypothetical protein